MSSPSISAKRVSKKPTAKRDLRPIPESQGVKMNKELDSCFCQAVEYNYERALQAILTKVEDPSAVVNKVYTNESEHFVPTLVACEKGYLSIVEILLQNGGVKSLTKLNKHKCNCLHTACRAGNFQMVKLLLKYAVVNKKKLIKQKSENEFNLHHPMILITGPLKSKVYDSVQGTYRWTPLMFAIQAKQVDIVNYLLKVPAITFDSLTKKGQNIAHIAAQYSLDCLKAIQAYLLKKAIQRSLRETSSSLYLATDKEGWGVLHRACAGDNIDTLKWILNLRRKLDAPSDDGYSDDLPLLFEGKVNERTESGYTPLLVACEYQHKDMVEYLLSLPGVDASVSTSMEGSGKGNTGLHIAAIHDSPDIAELLINYGCPTKVINKKGDTALHIAQRRSSLGVLDILNNSKDVDLLAMLNQNGQRADELEHEEVLPPEILKRGPNAVRVYRKALREGKQKIPQCKLLVLGEARVGKTSLIHHMIGLDFNPDLDPTRGIENRVITTMIDSANIDVGTWKTISEGEQAERVQEHCLRAIAQVIKAEYPTLLETETVNENSDNASPEPQILEDQLLSQIEDLIAKEELKQNESEFFVDVQHEDYDLSLEVSHPTTLPLKTPFIQTLPPHRQRNVGMNDQSTSFSPPIRKLKNASVHVASEASAAPNGPQTQPVISGPVHKPTAVNKEPVKGEVVTQIRGFGRRNAYQKLRTTAQKTEEPSLCLDVLDFAGQEVYRPMHHCFMSRRAIYIVVLNLQHILDPDKKSKTFSDLQYWLNSIHAHVHSPGYNYEKYIFLVGTHKHPGNGKHVTDDLLKNFSYELKEFIFRSDSRFKNEIHFYSHTDLIISGLENSMKRNCSGIEAIKKDIEEFSKYVPFLDEIYPISWLSFREQLVKRKLPESPLLQFTEAKEIAKRCGVEDQAVDTALQLFHDIGVIIYPAVIKSIFLEEFEKHQLSTVILMEPQWLISIMRQVMEMPMSHRRLRNEDMDKLKESGVASSKLLFELWNKDHKGDDTQFQIICLLMRAHGLMQVIEPLTESSCVRFMIPCLLREEKQQSCPDGYTFYFDFKGFLPQEVFHCLICLVIKKCQEVPGCSPPQFYANACHWFCFKGYNWYIQPLSQKHRLKVVVSPRAKKKPDLTPLECISFLHKEYICPICEQSGLPGLTYQAGPMVETCTVEHPPHSAGMLAAVCYPCSGFNGSEKSGKCPICCEEYDIEDVLVQTCTFQHD